MALDVANIQQNYRFENWSKSFSCNPDLFIKPESLDDLKKILDFATKNKRKIKVNGNGHSLSDIACTDDILINMKSFDKVLQVDKQRLRCTVEAGITLSELNRILDENQLALPALPSISDITLGGAIAVSTHSSGKNCGTLSSYVIHLEVLTATGLLINCSRALHADIFRAACCSLGAIGIITKITIQCQSAFYLRQVLKKENINTVLKNLDANLNQSKFFKFLWYPHSDDVVTIHSFPAKKPENMRKQKPGFLLMYNICGYLIEFFYWMGIFFPSIIPLVNRLGPYWLLKIKRQNDIVDTSWNIFNYNFFLPHYVSGTVSEWAIPMEKTGEAIHELKAWLDSQDSTVVAHFPVEVRFSKADDINLSPAFGRDTAYINILLYRPYLRDVPKEKYWTAFERIMAKHSGRPHWAKEHHVTGRKFRDIYPKFEEWCRVRETLDPHGILINREDEFYIDYNHGIVKFLDESGRNC